MKIILPAQLIKDLAHSSDDERLLNLARFRSKDEATEIDLSQVSEDLVESIRAAVEKLPEESPLKKAAKTALVTWDNIGKDPTGTKCRHLKSLASILRKRLAICPRKWLFKREEDGFVVPYYVSKIDYQPYDARNQREASVGVSLLA